MTQEEAADFLRMGLSTFRRDYAGEVHKTGPDGGRQKPRYHTDWLNAWMLAQRAA